VRPRHASSPRAIGSADPENRSDSRRVLLLRLLLQCRQLGSIQVHQLARTADYKSPLIVSATLMHWNASRWLTSVA
jgi:hypothetical protein